MWSKAVSFNYRLTRSFQIIHKLLKASKFDNLRRKTCFHAEIMILPLN